MIGKSMHHSQCHLQNSLERWGLDSPSHAMKKPANWLPFIKLKPKRNADLVKSMMEMRCAGNIDEVLRSLAAFLKINKPEVGSQVC